MFNSFIEQGNNIMYGYLLLTIFAIAAVLFTILFKGAQFRYAFHSAKLLIEKHEGGGTSGFASYAISTASRVGTGNMAGIMAAISIGGPGAMFWMWLMALFSSSLAFAESSLAQLYKEKDRNGNFVGGASFYIKSQLKKPALALLFAVIMIFTYTSFNGMQANTISSAFQKFGFPAFGIGIILTVVTAAILLHPKRDALIKACVYIVPIMAVPYILAGVIVFIMNINLVPQVFLQIFKEAFAPSAAFGGAIGTTVAIGLRRGLFSNEAGMGGSPHAAAAATTTHPARQGFVQMFAVFTDTLLICSVSGFILLLSPDAMTHINDYKGIQLLQYAMDSHFGHYGSLFITICIFFFAYSSVLGNFFYIRTGASAIKDSKITYYIVVAMTLCLVMGGSIISFNTMWNMGDFFMGLMAILNLIVLVILYKPAMKLLQHYEKQKKEGIEPVYRKGDIPEIESDAITQWDGK